MNGFPVKNSSPSDVQNAKPHIGTETGENNHPNHQVSRNERLICGPVQLTRLLCPSCGDYLMASADNLGCPCGHEFSIDMLPDRQRIVCHQTRRRKINPCEVAAVSERQENKCYWCGRQFGWFYFRQKSLIRLRACLDHKIPYAYGRNCSPDNLVAACNVCNGFKSSRMFMNEADCIAFLERRWAKEIAAGRLHDLSGEDE